MKKKQNLSSYNFDQIPSARLMRFSIVVSQWNEGVTESLFNGAYDTLIKHSCPKSNIYRYNVPGSFELVAGAKYAFEQDMPSAVICLGCVIEGETRHFEFISNAVANGMVQLNITYKVPFIFGILTTDNEKQARERAGGKHGNKGVEAAIAAIKMAAMKTNKKKQTTNKFR